MGNRARQEQAQDVGVLLKELLYFCARRGVVIVHGYRVRWLAIPSQIWFPGDHGSNTITRSIGVNNIPDVRPVPDGRDPAKRLVESHDLPRARIGRTG
jgi:hypothetical protein